MPFEHFIDFADDFQAPAVQMRYDILQEPLHRLAIAHVIIADIQKIDDRCDRHITRGAQCLFDIGS